MRGLTCWLQVHAQTLGEVNVSNKSPYERHSLYF